MTMGTASTMASMAEALSMQLPYSAIRRRWTRAGTNRAAAGQVVVDLVRQDLRPSAVMTRAAFDAIRVDAAISRSTRTP